MPYYEVLLAGIVRQRKHVSFWEKAVAVCKYAAKKVLPQGRRIRWAVGGLYWRLK